MTDVRLAVHDPDEALRFYRDVLGFQVRDDAGPGEISVSPPSQPDLRIVLEDPGAHRGVAPGRLVVVTGDCDATFERLEAAGADVMQEPISRPSGVRDCAFGDPWGNLLRFTQPRRP